MRITTKQLTKNQADWVKNKTEEKHEAINPETKEPVSVDFSKDLYSLLDTLTPHKSLKNFVEIDSEVANGYIQKKFTDYLKIRQHYSAIKKFLREFTHTRLYQHLQSLNNPEKALELLLQMFSPPPPSNQNTQKTPQNGQNNENNQNQSQSQCQEEENEQSEKNQQKQQPGNQPGEEKNNNQQNSQEQSKEQEDKQEQENQPNQQKGNSNPNKQNEQPQPPQEQSDIQDSQEQSKEQEDKQEQKNQQNQPNQQKGNSNPNKQNEQPQPPQEQSDSQDSQDKNQPEKMDNSQEEELSDNPPPPLLDLDKFKQNMPSIEEALKNNVFDNDMMRNLMEKQAGTAHNALTTIEGLSENIDKISAFMAQQNFKILDAARKFSATEQYTRDENLSDVIYPEKDWRVTNIKTMSDLPKVLPYQFLYPDAVFDKMLLDKDLKIKQHQSRKKKKQVLYILIDGSGSMTTLRQMTASAIAIAYIRKAIEEKSIYFFRHFDTEVFSLHTVTNEKEAVKEIGYLMNNPKSGGGTSIDYALKHAIKDINNPKLFKQDKKDKSELYERADILIITDGEDTVRITKEYLEEKKIVLHSFLLDDHNEELKKISHSYQHFSTNEMHKIIHN